MPLLKLLTKPIKQLGSNNSHELSNPVWNHSINFFVTTGPTLSARVKASQQSPETNQMKTAVFLQQTDPQEAAKSLRKIKTKKRWSRWNQ